MNRLTAFLAVLLCTAPPVAAARVPRIDFLGDSVRVSSFSAGSQVAWFFVERTPDGYVSTITSRTALSATEIDGSSTLQLETPYSPYSVWMAADLTTGQTAAGNPGDGPVAVFAASENLLRQDSSGLMTLLVEAKAELHLFLARPGQGAWVSRVSDGAPDDRDGAPDGEVEVSLQDFRSVDGQFGSPGSFSAGDILTLVDPSTLEIAVIKVTQ